MPLSDYVRGYLSQNKPLHVGFIEEVNNPVWSWKLFYGKDRIRGEGDNKGWVWAWGWEGVLC